MELTLLQRRLIKQIVAHVRRENLPEGARLKESWLADALDTSRSPIRLVLGHLATQGIVKKTPFKGYTLSVSAEKLTCQASRIDGQAEAPLYVELSRLRKEGVLPSFLTETTVMRTFDVPRQIVRASFFRMQNEGWAEHVPGQGWRILTDLDSARAFQECYTLRSLIESSGIEAEQFSVTEGELEACRERQQYIVSDGHLYMTPQELYADDVEFHELVSSWSGNRFLFQELRRVNGLRRLMDLDLPSARDRYRGQALEHLEIIDLIAQGEMSAASKRLRSHIEAEHALKVRYASHS